MKNRRIISVVSNDLAGDQRVHKMAMTLMNAGYRVELVGRLLPNSPEMDRSYEVVRFRLWFNKGPAFYLALNLRLFFHLLFSKADCLVANDLDTLPAVRFAAWFKRLPFILDSHEYFTEVPELINRTLVKRIWKGIERRFLPKANAVVTVNQAIADLFVEEYGVRVYVIMNLPLSTSPSTVFSAPEIPQSFRDKKMILYQGAVNVGRGLEHMIAALPLLPGHFLAIAGDGDVLPQLKEQVRLAGLEQQVWFVGRLPFEQLKELTRQAWLGMSLEQDLGLNYRLASPNKVFDYMHAGVPSLVSDLPVMGQLVRQEGCGQVIDHFDPESIRQAIKEMERDEPGYQRMKEAAIHAAERYTWEAQEERISNIFNAVIASHRPPPR